MDKLTTARADDETRLEDLLAHASSLALITYGACGDSFRSLRNHDQDNVLRLLSGLIIEIDEVSRRLIWNREGDSHA